MSSVAFSRDDAARAAGTLLLWDGADALIGSLRFTTRVLLLLDAPLRFATMPRDDAEAPRALSVAYLTAASRILCNCGLAFRRNLGCPWQPVHTPCCAFSCLMAFVRRRKLSMLFPGYATALG